MIKITREMDLLEFEAWSGGRDVLNNIKVHNRRDEIVEFVTEYINAYSEYGLVTDTWVNDFLWFDVEGVLIDDLDINIFE